MATNVYLMHFTSLTGGGSGALDAIDVSGLDAGAIAMGIDSDVWRAYKLVDSADGYSESTPTYVFPDTPDEDKYWALVPASSARSGQLVRPFFLRKDDDEIYINFGGYNLDGIGYVHWDAQLTYQFSSVANGDISYLYIDYSTISGAGEIDETNFTDSVTEPSFSQSKGGWYNGNDLCVFAVLGTTGDVIYDFRHDGGRRVSWPNVSQSNTVPGTGTYTSITLSYVPVFTSQVDIEAILEYSTAQTYIWAKASSTASEYTIPFYVDEFDAQTRHRMYEATVYIDSSQVLRLMRSGTIASHALTTNAWYFGSGM